MNFCIQNKFKNNTAKLSQPNYTLHPEAYRVNLTGFSLQLTAYSLQLIAYSFPPTPLLNPTHISSFHHSVFSKQYEIRHEIRLFSRLNLLIAMCIYRMYNRNRRFRQHL